MVQDFLNNFETISKFLEWWLRNPVLDEPHAGIFNRYYKNYKKYFGSYIQHNYVEQSREVSDLLKKQSGVRLLEIGCGCGTEALWFALRGAKVLAIDINVGRLAVARERQAFVERNIGCALDLEFRLSSVFDFGKTAVFDVVWMEQAFHHIEPRERLYAMLEQILVPGGHVVISETNGWNPLIQLLLLRRRGFSRIVDRVIEDGTHVLYGNERITIPSVLTREFAKLGFEQQSVRYFRALPARKISEQLMWLEQILPSFAPLFTHYNFVARRPR